MATNDDDLLRWVYGDDISNAAYEPMLATSWYPVLRENMAHPQHEVFASDSSRLSVRERMLVNLAILSVLGRERSVRSRCHGLLRGGFDVEELAEVFRMTAFYAGMPAGVECSEILAEAERDLKAAGVLPLPE